MIQKAKNKKKLPDIASEWDLLADVRFSQIVSGADITFNHVIAPIMLNLYELEGPGLTIDAGCGVGVLSAQMAAIGGEVIGVDPSGKSVEKAILNYGDRCKFYISSLDEFMSGEENFADVIVANMVLMDVLDLMEFLQSAARLLKYNGAFIFSMTHPFFWPDYHGYAKEKWFDYKQEIVVESPFRISKDNSTTLISTHVHRPLEMYIEYFYKCGLRIEKFIEPMPSIDIHKLYPIKWVYPRFVVGLCRKADI